LIQTNNNGDLIQLLRKWLGIVLYVSIVGELVFFPSWANLCGCGMALMVWLLFRQFFLKRDVILQHPFAFLMFLSMFLYRYLPLIATLLEGKPITYGFEVPYETFFYETLLFMVSSMAFAAAISKKRKRNNLIQRTLCRLRFFKTDARTLWLLGLVGLVVYIQQLSVAGEVEYGDVGNKFLAGLTYLQYAPVIMLFPTLCGIAYNKGRNTFVWFYVGVIFVTSFATNSRQAMINPIITIILLFFFYLLRQKISIYRMLSPVKIVIAGVVVVFGLSFVSDISLAMLANRNIRSDVSRSELLVKTVETMQDKQTMQLLQEVTLEKSSHKISYRKGWDETYLNNFMLNRYGNMRISDETLYYADKIGWENNKIQDIFFQKAITIYPLPVLNLLGYKVNKSELEYSPGDMLYMTAGGVNALLGGYRVTSHIGDGLATFGLLYFIIQFVLFFLIFKLLDCFVMYGRRGITYSTLGLINVFGFLGMFRNAGGCGIDLCYLLRGFWQQCFTFWLVLFIIRLITFNEKKV